MTGGIFDEAWSALDPGFRGALDQAWLAFRCEGLPVGTTVSQRGSIVGAGRNRVYDARGGSDTLQHTPLAHAELNAIASVPDGTELDTCEMWTTQRPCSMCQAAIDFTGVDAVHFLASDPSADEPETPYRSSGDAADIWIVVANVLFLHGVARVAGVEHPMLRRNAGPEASIVRLARDLVEDGALIDTAGSEASALDALRTVWDRILVAAEERPEG